MYRYGITLVCVLCFIVPSCLFAQGMNNKYPLDSTDVAVAIDMLGFRIFKFPVHTTSGKKVHLNYTTEVYEKGTLVESYNHYKGLIKTLPQEMVMDMLPLLNTSESVVRLYWRDISRGEVPLRISVNNFSTDIRWDIDSTTLGSAQYRAMAYSPSEPLSKRVPIAVRYAHTADKNMISCPGDASVEKIVQLYSHVIVVYIEPVEEEQE